MVKTAVHRHSVESLPNPVHEAVTQASKPWPFLFPFLHAQQTSLAESNNAGDIQRSRPQAALVAATIHLSAEPHARTAAANVEGSNSFRAVHLVRGKRHQVDLVFLDIHRNLAGGLGGIDVKRYLVLPSDFKLRWLGPASATCVYK